MSKTLDRITALLAKAEGTDNVAERDAYMSKAQQLATIAAIDLEVARQRQRDTGKRETPISRSIIMFTGERRYVKGRDRFIRLFLTVAAVNDVTCNIYHNSTGVIAFGFPSSIEVTEALYGSLAVQMKTAADAYLKSGAHKQEIGVYVDRHTGERVARQLDGRTARRAFYTAFIEAVGERLEQARRDAQQSTVIDPEAAGSNSESAAVSAELVLVGRREEVAKFYQQASTARGTWRGGSRAGNYARTGGARAAGHAAGTQARLGAPRGVANRSGEIAS